MIAPLIVDAYAKDFGGKPDIAKLVAAGYPWCGFILKATEGTYYPSPHQEDWFMSHWLPTREIALERYGMTRQSCPSGGGFGITPRSTLVPFYRGAYHYFRADEDPIAQADRYLLLIERAGGWGPGDLWPMIDVESGENPPDISAAQLEDGVSRWASKVTGTLGRSCMLYGNVYVWERGVRSHMNCGLLTVARYANSLPATTYQRIGWDIARPAAIPTVWGWQYAGDPDGSFLDGYPSKCPMSDTEDADITALIVGGGSDPQAMLDWTTENLSR